MCVCIVCCVCVLYVHEVASHTCSMTPASMATLHAACIPSMQGSTVIRKQSRLQTFN